MLLLTALISASVLFAGLRGNIGTDTFAYRDYYNNAGTEEQTVFFEPIFFLLSLIGKTIGLDSQFLIFSTALLQGIFIYLSIKIIKEKDIYYLLVLSAFYTSLSFNLIRVGLAIYILGYALLLKESDKQLQSKIAVTISTLTHLSTIISVPFFARKWYYLLVPIILICIANFDLIELKLLAYFIGGNLVISDFDIGIGFIIVNILILSCLHMEGMLFDRLVFIIFMTSIILKVISFSIPIIDRFSIIFEFMLLTILVSRVELYKSKLIIIFIILYGIYKNIAFISNSDEAMRSLILEYPGMALLYGDTHWIPYEFFWK